MSLRTRRGPKAEIFTGSMADISFLLIVFFMLTAVFSVGMGIDFAVPEAPKKDDRIVAEEAIDVHVLANGSLEVDHRSMAISQLLPYIKAKLAVAAEKPVLLRTDPEAPYRSMIAVLDELRSAPEKAGFEITNLAIPTNQELNQVWSLFGQS